jgi:hypothetical protein
MVFFSHTCPVESGLPTVAWHANLHVFGFWRTQISASSLAYILEMFFYSFKINEQIREKCKNLFKQLLFDVSFRGKHFLALNNL